MVYWLVMDTAKRLRHQDERIQENRRNRAEQRQRRREIAHLTASYTRPEKEERLSRSHARQDSQKRRHPSMGAPVSHKPSRSRVSASPVAGPSDTIADPCFSMVLDLSDGENQELTAEEIDALQQQFLNEGVLGQGSAGLEFESASGEAPSGVSPKVN